MKKIGKKRFGLFQCTTILEKKQNLCVATSEYENSNTQTLMSHLPLYHYTNRTMFY